MAESTLDELSTEQLRERAFERARKHRDLGFFWDVVRHLPHAPEAAEVDGSLGSVGAAIDSVAELWHELTGHDSDYGAAEPLLRAKFIDYLAEPTER
ncbi:MAG: hypothetical protein ACRD0P_08835 [Stackebrandtia sp.]